MNTHILTFVETQQGITHSFWLESSPCSKSQFDHPVHTLKSPSLSADSILATSPGFPESYCDADLNLCFPDPCSWNSATNRDSCSIGASIDHSESNRILLEFALGTNSTCATIRSRPKRSNPLYPHTSFASLRSPRTYHSPACFASTWRSESNPPATITSSRTNSRLVNGRHGQEIVYSSRTSF